MSITLSALEEALFQGLARISPAAAAPAGNVTAGTARTINGAAVRYIGRWTGEPIRGAAIPDALRASILKECDNRTPALLLAFDGEVADPAPAAVRTLSGRTETVGLSTWSVLVVVRESRATRVLMQGTPAGAAATLGVLDGEQLVEEALTNLSVPGLWGVSGVRWLDTTPFMVTPGEGYILRVRYTARRVLTDVRDLGYDSAVDADPEYRELAGDVNLYPAGLAGDNLGATLVSVVASPYPVADPALPTPPLRALMARFDASAVMGLGPDDSPAAGPNATQRTPLWVDRDARFALAESDPGGQPTRSALGSEFGITFAAGQRLGGWLDWLPVGTRARTLAVHFRSATTTGLALQHLAGWGSSGGVTEGQEFALVLYPDGPLLRIGATVNGSTVLLEGPAVTDSPEWVVLLIYDGTTLTLRCKGTGLSEVDTAAVTLATKNDRRFELGRSGSLAATVREVLVYREALAADGQSAVIEYAQARYGAP